MKIYAGIGSRATPNNVIKKMESIGEYLARKDYILRSGHAPGADKAFERGCDIANGKKEIYLPWKGFEGSDSSFFFISKDAYKSVEENHINPHALSYGAKKLLARDYHQLLGYDNVKSDLVIYWTDNLSLNGGTGYTVKMARKIGIPTFNLYLKEEVELLGHFLKS